MASAREPLAGADRSRDAVPDDPRPQLPELLARVAPVEHVEHVLELRARQLRVGVGARQQRRQHVDGQDVVVGRRRHRDDLLRQHVERVARDDRRLDQPLAHALRDHRALQEVGAELGEDPPLRRVADVVAGAADPLQPRGDRLRRLDLQHEVHGAHVDAQLERGGRDQARQLSRLQLLLDHQPLLAGEAAVVGARDALLGQLVQPQRQPLGGAPVVDEDQRRGVLAHELEQLGVDRRPDRLAGGLLARERVQLHVHLLGLDHRFHGHVDLQVQRLAHAGVDHRRAPLRPDHEAADLFQRVLRRAQPHPLDVTPRDLDETLERDRQVRAALGLRDGVDLVQDHGLRALEHRPRLAREHQVQRLWRRDQDVRRVLDHVAPLLLRRVTGPDRDVQLGADPAQRRAQVLLDVVGERLQRRDVDEPRLLVRRPRDELVEPVEERGQRLARAGRRRDQDVLAGGDRRPGLGLRLGRRRERSTEPLAYLWGEVSERIRHAVHVTVRRIAVRL